MDSFNSQLERQPVYPVKFHPLPIERVWGGHDLKDVFRSRLLTDITPRPVGEYWILSEHPHGTSVVANGSYKGRTLVELTTAYPHEYLGASAQPRFPLLIKVLEAAADLSVQVHPTDAYAKANEGDYGKTEAWYVLDAKPDGTVIDGHTFASADELFAAAKSGTVADYLTHQKIAPGDVVFVPSMTLHALLAGTKVVEVQQTSDITYRVFDWNRTGDDGKPRELHLQKAADVLFNREASRDNAPQRVCDTLAPTDVEGTVDFRLLVQSDYFSMVEISIAQGRTATIHREGMESPDVVVIVDGSGSLTWDTVAQPVAQPTEAATATGTLPVELGDAVLVPTSTPLIYVCATNGPLTLLWVRYGRRTV